MYPEETSNSFCERKKFSTEKRTDRERRYRRIESIAATVKGIYGQASGNDGSETLWCIPRDDHNIDTLLFSWSVISLALRERILREEKNCGIHPYTPFAPSTHPYAWHWHIVHAAADWRLAIGRRHSAVPHDTQFPTGGRDLPRLTRRLWSHRLFITLMEVPLIHPRDKTQEKTYPLFPLALSSIDIWRSFKGRYRRRSRLVP